MDDLPDTVERLRVERDEVSGRLADARDEKAFIVRQSGFHLSREQWLRYDREIERYEERLAAIDARLAELGAEDAKA